MKKSIKANPFTKALVTIFESAGFDTIPSDLIDLTVKGITSEIDHIFAFQNVLVLCEKTTGQEIGSHFSKKLQFHEQIQNNKIEFIEVCRTKNPLFAKYVLKANFEPGDFEIRSIYYSENKSFTPNILATKSIFTLMSVETTRYFTELTKAIKKSAIYEILKFLDLSLAQIGDVKKSGRGSPSDTFKAFVLPQQHTHYPPGFSLVSFYIDPLSLIKRSYVLRRDGWEKSNITYQRFIKKEKLEAMRSYLAKDGKVFVNNLIITLPNSVKITDITTDATLSAENITSITPVRISLPQELKTIGIIDGQHRVLAYYEGDDDNEPKISNFRMRQNLLATGIIFPQSYSDGDRAKFEADLFLKINSNQTSISDSLKQEIETLINPDSAIALAKSVTTKLASLGPLSGLIQVGAYDPPDKIKTASFIRYTLLSVCDPQGKSSLYTLWAEGVVQNLSDASARDNYIEFCVRYINSLLLGVKKNLVTANKWRPTIRRDTSPGILNPTSLGGMFIYLRLLIRAHVDLPSVDYEETFKGVGDFAFADYGSSKWSAVADRLYEAYPPKERLDPPPDN
jgi:DGQHR domain-containing protein